MLRSNKWKIFNKSESYRKLTERGSEKNKIPIVPHFQYFKTITDFCVCFFIPRTPFHSIFDSNIFENQKGIYFSEKLFFINKHSQFG